VRDLNQTNKFKNEKTQIIFEIEELSDGQIVLLARISNGPKIRLCFRLSNRLWIVEQSAKYLHLSNWLLSLLKAYDNQKLNLKMTFNDYFKMKFDVLLAFKG
jgi:hypothetical protein